MLRTQLNHWADWLKKTRLFFENQHLLEVQTPYLLKTPVSDPYIDSIQINANQNIAPQTQYLHTSPEIAMKSLIANGSGDIYQICQAFRDNEQGQYNQNEFTLLEWYRLGFSLEQMIDDTLDFLHIFLAKPLVKRLNYAEAFWQFANIDILNSSLNELQSIAKQHKLNSDFDKIDGQILLFVHLIEPHIKQFPLCVVYDYPKEQSALAQTKGKVAKRFEVYVNGIEIANGYQEIESVVDYKQYFIADNQKRQQLNKPVVAIDDVFLNTIKDGLPPCSGVALGLSRLFRIIKPPH